MTTTVHPEDVELFEYVEGELDESRRLEVELHLSACRRCDEEVRLLETGRAALRDAPLLSLSEARRRGILAGLPRQSERRPWAPSAKRLVAILTPVAVAAAVAAVFVSMDGGDGGERAAVPAAAERSRDAQAERAPEPLQAAPPQSAGGAQQAVAPDAAPPEEPPPQPAPTPQTPSATGPASPNDEPAPPPPPQPPEPKPEAPPRDEAVKAGTAPAPEKAAPEKAAPTEAAPGANDSLAPTTAEGFAGVAPVARVAGPPSRVARVLRRAGFAAKATTTSVEVTGGDPDAIRRALADRGDGDVAVLVVP
jgi:anti-sigma factor RsiW